MDKETKQEFEKLGTMIAGGFSDVENKFKTVEERFNTERLYIEGEFSELRREIKPIRAELEQVPDDVNKTYSKILNDLLERVSKIEKQPTSA
jgi:archaellum component FlaC